MTRSELITRLASRNSKLPPKKTKQAVKLILEAVSTSLSNGRRVEIRGFGSFTLNYRLPRVGRNPKTGAAVQVPAKYVMYFRAAKELKKRVDYRKHS